MKKYSEEIKNETTNFPNLGAEYFESRDISRRFLDLWKEDYVEEITKEILETLVNPIVDTIKDRVMDAFLSHLLSDAEYNAQGEMRDMVEKSVSALIGGDNWANKKYISVEGYRTEKVRETLAKLYSDEIKDGRIADLEKEVDKLKKSLKYRDGFY